MKTRAVAVVMNHKSPWTSFRLHTYFAERLQPTLLRHIPLLGGIDLWRLPYTQ
ncbi:hypothetical protein [Candidatus Methylacidithermus pantelleriae]|uniref:hypothetical protein n=1 Tax=Candidatus Methylacidithermus pantelleriae TaxID=2744239 RepID=UPI00157CF3B0|nr:hypothetical protein [Candidatus Methylacidithermus pantelleriae]